MQIFDIKCPRCHGKAEALMELDGQKGTYREVYLAYRPHKATCSACGMVKVIEDPDDYSYELWFKTTFKGYCLWARNEDHIDSLIAWLRGGNRTPGDPYEALPKWMVTNREKVIQKLEQMKKRG